MLELQSVIANLKKELIEAKVSGGDAVALNTAGGDGASGASVIGSEGQQLGEMQAQMELFRAWRDRQERGIASPTTTDRQEKTTVPEDDKPLAEAVYPRLSVLNKDSMLSHHMVVVLDQFPFTIGRSARHNAGNASVAGTVDNTSLSSAAAHSPSGGLLPSDPFASSGPMMVGGSKKPSFELDGMGIERSHCSFVQSAATQAGGEEATEVRLRCSSAAAAVFLNGDSLRPLLDGWEGRVLKHGDRIVLGETI